MLVALGVWLVLASGLAGRVALLVEELPHWWADRRDEPVVEEAVPTGRAIDFSAPLRLAA